MEASPQSTTPANEELNCPLCGYDLRGLPSERCPECGHAFDVEELRRAKIAEREWLFELAPRRFIASFVRTSLASLLPIRFWNQVKASQTVWVARLKVWVMFWVLLSGVIFTLVFGVASAMTYMEMKSASTATVPAFSAGVATFTRNGVTYTVSRNNGRLVYVPSSPPPLWSIACQRVLDQAYFGRDVLPALAVVLWPAVTVAVLQIFGLTLRRAGIHSGHLWRCTLYAIPSIILPILILASLACFSSINTLRPYELPTAGGQLIRAFVPPFWWQLSETLGLSPVPSIAVTIAMLLSSVHLIAAHVRYLRLPHAFAQAVLVQAAACLAILCVLALFSGNVW